MLIICSTTYLSGPFPYQDITWSWSRSQRVQGEAPRYGFMQRVLTTVSSLASCAGALLCWASQCITEQACSTCKATTRKKFPNVPIVCHKTTEKQPCGLFFRSFRLFPRGFDGTIYEGPRADTPPLSRRAPSITLLSTYGEYGFMFGGGGSKSWSQWWNSNAVLCDRRKVRSSEPVSLAPGP